MHRRGPRKKRRNALAAVFIYAQVSVPACKCTCHVMPLSRLQSAVNLLLRLKAVGMGRDKESPREAVSGPHADAFLSYRRAANTKIKQKERCLYLFVYSSSACQISMRWQTAKSTTAARRERINVSSGAVYLTGDVIIIHFASKKTKSQS